MADLEALLRSAQAALTRALLVLKVGAFELSVGSIFCLAALRVLSKKNIVSSIYLYTYISVCVSISPPPSDGGGRGERRRLLTGSEVATNHAGACDGRIGLPRPC